MAEIQEGSYYLKLFKTIRFFFSSKIKCGLIVFNKVYQQLAFNKYYNTTLQQCKVSALPWLCSDTAHYLIIADSVLESKTGASLFQKIETIKAFP